mmetsp:Transcript_6728/g.11790  ORF Transcript_6728/g.11790 Transcript_6728/m.11790 type:complete len:87 (-) Transcript_6728:353-613(-)
MLPGSCKFKLTKIKQSDATTRKDNWDSPHQISIQHHAVAFFAHMNSFAAAPWRRVPQPISVEHWVALPCSQKLLPLNCLRQRGAPL